VLRRSGPVLALGCGAAFILATSAQSAAPPASRSPVAYAAKTAAPASPRRKVPNAHVTPPPQSASFNLGAQDGAFLVSVSSFGKKYTVDPNKLHFTIRSLEGRAVSRTPLHADVGEPVLDRSFDQEQSPGTVMGYHLPIAFPRPERPGMYEVAVVADTGFTRYDDGAVLPVDGRPHANVYWPDDAGDDAGLRGARTTLESHTVYGYGGIQLSCGVASSKTYVANVGVAVQSVERRRGTVQQLWTGALPSWGNDTAYSFFAVDPLAVKAAYPASASTGSGSSSAPAGDAPCPGFFLADPWHVDITVSTAKPPPLSPGSDPYKIALGMTRADVAWRRGYPQGYFTRAAINTRAVWAYDDGPGDTYTVTFREGRVATFTVPPGLP
jgi:hypothetical protein